MGVWQLLKNLAFLMCQKLHFLGLQKIPDQLTPYLDSFHQNLYEVKKSHHGFQIQMAGFPEVLK